MGCHFQDLVTEILWGVSLSLSFSLPKPPCCKWLCGGAQVARNWYLQTTASEDLRQSYTRFLTRRYWHNKCLLFWTIIFWSNWLRISEWPVKHIDSLLSELLHMLFLTTGLLLPLLPVPNHFTYSNPFSGLKWDDTSSRKPPRTSLVRTLITSDSKQHEGRHTGLHDSLLNPLSAKGLATEDRFNISRMNEGHRKVSPLHAELRFLLVPSRWFYIMQTLRPEVLEAMLLIYMVIILNSNLIFPPRFNISSFILFSLSQ